MINRTTLLFFFLLSHTSCEACCGFLEFCNASLMRCIKGHKKNSSSVAPSRPQHPSLAPPHAYAPSAPSAPSIASSGTLGLSVPRSTTASTYLSPLPPPTAQISRSLQESCQQDITAAIRELKNTIQRKCLSQETCDAVAKPLTFYFQYNHSNQVRDILHDIGGILTTLKAAIFTTAQEGFIDWDALRGVCEDHLDPLLKKLFAESETPEERIPATQTMQDITQRPLVLARIMAKDKKVQLIEQIDPRLIYYSPLHVAHALATQRVLQNISFNGIHYTSGCPIATVTVRATPSDSANKIIYSVEDTGPGMSPDVLSKLFSQGFRGDTKKTGSGIGLWSSQRLADGMMPGSKITVESVLGRGSVFTFEVPCQHSSPSLPLQPQSNPSAFWKDFAISAISLPFTQEVSTLTPLALSSVTPLKHLYPRKNPSQQSLVQQSLASAVPLSPATLPMPITETLGETPNPLSLPLADLSALAASSPTRWRHIPFSQLRILIIDDTPISVKLLRMLLERLGISNVFDKSCQNDALEAFEKALQPSNPAPFHLLLVDYNLGEGMNGQQLIDQVCQKVAKTPGAVKPIILSISATTDGESRALMGKAVDEFFPKPFETMLLQTLLKRFFKSPRSSRN